MNLKSAYLSSILFILQSVSVLMQAVILLQGVHNHVYFLVTSVVSSSC